MDYVKLKGRNIRTDAERIRNGLKRDGEMVFLYCAADTLYDYIQALCDEGKLDDETLYQLKFCYSTETLNVSFLVQEAEQWTFKRHIASIADLIRELDGKTPCRIVVNTDSRKDLSFIAQQLIFIRYPLELADVLLSREAREMEKESLFWQRADKNLEEISEKLKALFGFSAQVPDTDSCITAEISRKAQETLRTCNELRWQMEFLQMELFQSRKVKLAIAASKKTGKSVMVNCFIGEAIAPTDVQLATPNNCIYQKSPDGKYHLQIEGSGEERSFSSREELRQTIEEQFRAAQHDREHGFSLPDMRISYLSDNHFSACEIYDTPGPDAAGSTHREAALRSMNECDMFVFAIDYGKYLTDSEMEYLREMGRVFKSCRSDFPLIIALNKIDFRYYDSKKSKSIVAATDFIKNRLGKIEEDFRDCVIFPTCALEYLSAVEAENAGVTELRVPASSDDMKKVRFAHKDVPALAVLHEHAENLEYYRGIQEFSYDVFKRDSGMPALMNYVFRMAIRTGAHWRNVQDNGTSDVLHTQKKTENSRNIK